VRRGTDASFEMIRGIAREPQKTYNSHTRAHRSRLNDDDDDGRMCPAATNERGVQFKRVPSPSRNATLRSMNHSMRNAFVIRGLTLKTSSISAVRAQEDPSSSTVVVVTVVDPPSIELNHFVSSLRVAVVDRGVSRVPRACTARVGKADPSRASTGKGRLGAAPRRGLRIGVLCVYSLFTYTFWFTPSVRFWCRWAI